MRFALVGDIHCHRTLVAPWRLMNKRLLGVLNLAIHRRGMFDHNLLNVTMKRVASIQPDALLLSGDFSSTSLPEEFDHLAKVLRQFTDGIPTFAVPGNHDRYTGESRRGQTVERHMAGWLPFEFPHLQPLFGRWHLLRLDPACPSFFSSTGELGPDQLARAGKLLATLTASDGVIVLCHYHLIMPAGLPARPGHRLIDRAPLLDLLSTCPARQLYLHGHIHQPWIMSPPPGEPLADRLIDINAGSPTMCTPAYPLGQGFWEIELDQDPRISPVCRRHVPDDADGRTWSIRPQSPGENPSI